MRAEMVVFKEGGRVAVTSLFQEGIAKLLLSFEWEI